VLVVYSCGEYAIHGASRTSVKINLTMPTITLDDL